MFAVRARTAQWAIPTVKCYRKMDEGFEEIAKITKEKENAQEKEMTIYGQQR